MRKMDEMEMAISLKAIRLAWIYTIVFLFVWTTYDLIVNKRLNFPTYILLITQNITFLGSQLYFKRKMTNNEK